MRLALDALGGDHGPHITVEGAYHFLHDNPEDTVLLVGCRDKIREELKKVPTEYHSRMPIVHAPENITMSESPTDAVKRKKNSSMVVGLNLQKDGEVEGFVSAGSTGAQMAGSLLILGRLSGVKRPAIGVFLPSESGMVYLLDAGANVDSKPVHLLQFAIMGNIFVSQIFDKETSTVGLLSNGEESSKGSENTIASHKLLKEHLPNFYGNIEGGDIFKGKTDIIVCDGFIGNIMLKMVESVMGVILHQIRRNIGKNLVKNFGAMLVKPAFSALKQSFNYEEYGGVPLLGVNGISIICHGKSSSIAIKNALRVAKEMKEKEVNSHIQKQLKLEEAINAKAS
ncbi:MAG: phosphate acyltransferase PlsX [Calditrichaeota bacterium]|nr:MAG: phosphate acyltransferase PlsX [Calditrichota bacterium]MBL1203777.1 phosphate acyltransferase PlsX [Calditrichota bacterium]NOG43607.1 phosphate acyltransferase PlsX [Calditrichota bacterium]